MTHLGKLPYSDERLASIMEIHPSELKCSPRRDEIKDIVREYNLTLDAGRAVNRLSHIANLYACGEYWVEAIKRLILYIKLG